jgi:hypothetical protein
MVHLTPSFTFSENFKGFSLEEIKGERSLARTTNE